MDGDDNLSNRVSSWLTEELRRMQGVEVVDSAGEWEIHVMVMQTKNQGGTVTGYALSEVVLSRFDQNEVFGAMALMDTLPSHRSVWDKVTGFALVARGLEDHHLAVGPLEHLRDTIEGLAATFDTKELEPSRKAWEKARRG
jgi:hypothetical protein